MPEKNYTEIVLTGGPCAGKTTIASHLVSDLGDQGVRVLASPEVASLLITSGLGDIGELKESHPILHQEFERQILLFQGDLRQRFRALAESFAPEPVCIIYDRAEMDAASYLPPGRADEMLREAGSSGAEAREAYDCVVHLRTAALLGPEFYLDNNPARYEGYEEALDSDRRTLESWIGHRHLWIIEASHDFEDKKNRVLEVVRRAVGIDSREIERKFLLARAPDTQELSRAHRVDITQTYLLSPAEDVELRVRCRKSGDYSLYQWTEKRPGPDPLIRQEREALISKREYHRLLADADPERQSITKTRYQFAHGDQHFELDCFERKEGGSLWLLEVELIRSDDPVYLPPYLEIEAEVTDDPRFRSGQLARG